MLFCSHEEEGFSPDHKPLGKQIQSRVLRAAQYGAPHIILEDTDEQSESNCCQSCSETSYCPSLQPPSEPPKLAAASKAGFKLMPGFFLPAVPKLLEDVWVGIELFVTIFDFIFASAIFEPEPLNGVILALTTLGMLLAFLDGFLYFIQGGSCITSFRYLRKKVKRSKGGESDEEQKKPCFQLITDQQKKKMNMWFQLIRTVLSEAILYPLAVADILDLLAYEEPDEPEAAAADILQLNSTEDPSSGSTHTDRIDFSLFLIGSFYLLLSVYFMRIFMAISSVVSLYRLPKTTENNYARLMIKFCLLLMGQVLVQITALFMIATKVSYEQNPSCVRYSAFLWVVVVIGYVLPFLGLLLFFVLNYAQLKLFSIGMYVDLTSSMMTEGFADLVFQGEGIKTVKTQAKKAATKSDVASVRDQFNNYSKDFTLPKRIFYRITNPFAVIGSLAYFVLIVAFLVCHVLTVNCGGGVESVLPHDAGVTVMFFIGLIFVLTANYESVLLASFALVIIVLVVAAVLLSPVIAIVLTLLLVVAVMVYTVVQSRKRAEADTADEPPH